MERINLYYEVLVNTANAIEKVLMNINENHRELSNCLQWFFGGSYRFGYTSIKSDIDIFVYVNKYNHPNIPSIFRRILKANFFSMNGEKYYPNAEGWQSYDEKIHLNIFTDEEIFHNLLLEHACLDSYIEKNPDMIKVAYEMKMNHMAGKDIYRALCRIMNQSPDYYSYFVI